MKRRYQKSMRALHHLISPAAALVLHNSHRARVLLIAGDHILLERSYFGSQKWSLPGGGVKKGEPLATAAARELEEEVGITVDPADLKPLGSKRLPTNVAWSKANIHLFTLRLPKQQNVHISHPKEIIEAQWWSITSLPDNLNPVVSIALDLLRDIDKTL